MLITEKTILGDLLAYNPAFEDILLQYGMHCPGCPAARDESIAEACEVHGININDLLQQINALKG